MLEQAAFDERVGLFNSIKQKKEDLEEKTRWIKEYGDEREKTNEAIDLAKEANRELDSSLNNLSDNLNEENLEGYTVKMDQHKAATLKTMTEIDQLLLNIREAIERTQTLVNEVSLTVKVD